jgi:hypothetical protein
MRAEGDICASLPMSDIACCSQNYLYVCVCGEKEKDKKKGDFFVFGSNQNKSDFLYYYASNFKTQVLTAAFFSY